MLLALQVTLSKSSLQISHKEELKDEVNGKSDEVMQKGQIIQEEEREKDKVGFWVSWRYITMAYKGALVPLILLLARILFQILQICSNYWMTSEAPLSEDLQPTVSDSTLVAVYVALAVGSSACYLISTLLLVTVGYLLIFQISVSETCSSGFHARIIRSKWSRHQYPFTS